MAAYLEVLVEDVELRTAMGQAAARYVRTHHAVDRTAGLYARFLAGLIRRRRRASPQQRVLESLRQACIELGIG